MFIQDLRRLFIRKTKLLLSLCFTPATPAWPPSYLRVKDPTQMLGKELQACALSYHPRFRDCGQPMACYRVVSILRRQITPLQVPHSIIYKRLDKLFEKPTSADKDAMHPRYLTLNLETVLNYSRSKFGGGSHALGRDTSTEYSHSTGQPYALHESPKIGHHSSGRRNQR